MGSSQQMIKWITCADCIPGEPTGASRLAA